MAPKPIREEAGTVGIPSIVVKAANPLRIKSVNGVFTLTLTVQHMGEQGNSMAALETKQSKRVMLSSF
ncbi:MAG TPA: hypothetical protein VMI10_00095 [Terriglobales bacterium]|nr:hypothetical protein [Terriglobales bacterium]HVO63856.1 hypothetical protein [Terriglobales bacterium]HXJ85526.1 hypothetical protein [Candidatus Binatia bacterium]